LVSTASPCSPLPCGDVCGLWAALGWSIPWVCLSASVATAVCVTTPEEASAQSGVTLSRRGLLLRRVAPSPQGCCRGAFPRRDGITTAQGDVTVPVCASGVPWFRLGCRRVPQGWLSLRTFRWGTRQVTWLRSVTEGGTFVAVSWLRCLEGRVCLIID
ncbi:hypothetical protein Taro_050315, partial [Colocasia esculenta]|nr:hypothetical protein [Colocasia esculenta]